jgi:hypothetical protein
VRTGARVFKSAAGTAVTVSRRAVRSHTGNETAAADRAAVGKSVQNLCFT